MTRNELYRAYDKEWKAECPNYWRFGTGGIVYIAECEGGYFKVGTTRGYESLSNRFRKMRTSNPTIRIAYERYSSVAVVLERLIHADLDIDHVNGEWFKLDSETLCALVDIYGFTISSINYLESQYRDGK